MANANMPAPAPGFWAKIVSGLQPKDAITITISLGALALTGFNFWWSNLRIDDQAYGYVTRVGPTKTVLAQGETSPMSIDLFVRNAGNRPVSLSEAYLTLAYRHCEDDRVVEDGSKGPTKPLPSQFLVSDALPFTEKAGEAGIVKFVLPFDFFAGWFPPADTESKRDVVASLKLTTMASDNKKHEAIFDCLFKVDPETNMMQMINDYTFKHFPPVSLLGAEPQ